jgi:ribonuclease HII
MPDFSFEHALMEQGYTSVAGVDEVGRGPWAGPVTAAAVILKADHFPAARDSKKLSPPQRLALYETICHHAHIGVGEASVEEIDTLNIRNATFLAMRRALKNLPQTPDYALIDGNAIPPGLPCPAQALTGGDDRALSIACASIIAKVTRDRLMQTLHKAHPHFGWNTNAGYGTKTHQEGLNRHGITSHHRKSFRPVQKIIQAS